MRLFIATAITAASLARAQFQLLLPRAGGAISPRDFGDGICVQGSTCEECFGEGYIICDRIGCFNPDLHQQCCKDASLCVASSDSCCDDFDGKGEVGTAGAPAPNTLPPPDPSATNVWSCTRKDTGEECCHRGGPDMHSCFGNFDRLGCYNATNQWCCTDGTVCDEEGCCKNLFSLETAHPWTTDPAAATPNGGDGKKTGTNGATGAAETSTGADATPTEDAKDAASLRAVTAEIAGLVALVISIGLLL